MADGPTDRVQVKPVGTRAVVSLRVVRHAAEEAGRRLGLAAPLRFTATEPRSLWQAPDHWWLISERIGPDDLIARVGDRLAGILHLAVDYGAAVVGLRVAGLGARTLLSGGTGLDLTPANFATGACARTRLARIRALVVAIAPDALEVYLDRGLERYFRAWLADAVAAGAEPVSPDPGRPGSR